METKLAPSTLSSGESRSPPNGGGGTATTIEGPVPPSAMFWPGIARATATGIEPEGMEIGYLLFGLSLD